MTIYMVKIPKTSCSDYSEVITMRVETMERQDNKAMRHIGVI